MADPARDPGNLPRMCDADISDNEDHDSESGSDLPPVHRLLAFPPTSTAGSHSYPPLPIVSLSVCRTTMC